MDDQTPQLNPADHHICIFLPDLGGGGAERVMLTLANEFARRRYIVDLIVTSGNGKYEHLLEESVRFVNLDTGRMLRTLSSFTKYLRRNRPTIILSTLYYANLLALLARIVSGVQARTFIRIETVLSRRIPENTWPKARLHSFLVKRLFPWADGIIAVSQGVARDTISFLKVDPAKIQTIYNPGYPDDIDRAALEPIDDDGLRPDLPLIVAAGRLNKQKDFSTLIKAFSIVHAIRPATLFILGEGEERKALEYQISEMNLERNIHLLGFVENPFKYMSRASVFVLSSRFEGLPGSLIQALRCGCPVVSTDCEWGPAEILENGRYGKLVPVGNPEALAQAIAKTLGERTDASELIGRAKKFSTEQAVREYLEFFASRGPYFNSSIR